jgi:hypothetical protein
VTPAVAPVVRHQTVYQPNDPALGPF